MPLVESYKGKGTGEQLYDEGSFKAYSKPEQGDGYKLNSLDVAKLGMYLERAQKLASSALKFLIEIEKDLNGGNFLRKDGCLTSAGLLIDHFNLTRNLTAQKKSEKEVIWTLIQNPSFHFSSIDCRLLYNYVRTVVGMTNQGLCSPLIFRGINEYEVNNSTGGMIRWRDGNGPRKVRASGPEIVAPTELAKIPKLHQDQIFGQKDMQGGGAIHLNYISLGQKPAVDVHLTILHEATHKFARTIDVDAPHCYSVKDCRKMDWTLAVRNAAHHERFMGTDWEAILTGKNGQTSRKYVGFENK